MIIPATLLLLLATAVQSSDLDARSEESWSSLTQAVAAETGLTIHLCNDVSGHQFLCEKIFGEFCTYCHSSEGEKCVPKKGVKHAEKAGYHCGPDSPSPSPSPEPSPSPKPSPKPSPSPAPSPHHHKKHHHSPSPKPEPAPEPHHRHHHHRHHHHRHHSSPQHDDPMAVDMKVYCHYPNKALCQLHHTCEWCSSKDTNGDGSACYTRNDADLLPRALWDCHKSKPYSKPLIKCHYTSEAKCVVHPDCKWCETSDKAGPVGDGCYTSGQADLLPEKIWSCSVAKQLPKPEAVEKPLVKCHYTSESKCIVHPDCKWCETSDKAGPIGDGCYTSGQADLLPEKIWSCSV